MVVWLLLIYTMGVMLTMTTLKNGIDMMDDMMDDPWAALMWPILLIALFIKWLEDK